MSQPDEWTDEKRQRLAELEREAHTIWPPSMTKQRALKDRVDAGELADDTARASEAEMDPE
jgi:hypothetical protein